VRTARSRAVHQSLSAPSASERELHLTRTPTTALLLSSTKKRMTFIVGTWPAPSSTFRSQSAATDVSVSERYTTSVDATIEVLIVVIRPG
jgi:hypothetical protein